MKRALVCILFLVIGSAPSPLQGMDAGDFFNRGLESTMTNKKIAYFTQALTLNPALVDAYEERGMLYFFQEKYDDMIKDFQKVVRYVPNQAGAFWMLGVGYLKTCRYDAAISMLTRAIELDPDLVGAYAHRAEAYFRSRRYEDAIRNAATAIGIADDPLILAESHRIKYKAYRKLGLTDAAYRELSHAWRIDPRVWQVWRSENGGFIYPQYARKMGLLTLIALAGALIFKMKLHPPEK